MKQKGAGAERVVEARPGHTLTKPVLQMAGRKPQEASPRAHTESRWSPSLLGRAPHHRKGGGERWPAWTRAEP